MREFAYWTGYPRWGKMAEVYWDEYYLVPLFCSIGAVVLARYTSSRIYTPKRIKLFDVLAGIVSGFLGLMGQVVHLSGLTKTGFETAKGTRGGPIPAPFVMIIAVVPITIGLYFITLLGFLLMTLLEDCEEALNRRLSSMNRSPETILDKTNDVAKRIVDPPDTKPEETKFEGLMTELDDRMVDFEWRIRLLEMKLEEDNGAHAQETSLCLDPMWHQGRLEHSTPKKSKPTRKPRAKVNANANISAQTRQA